MGVAYGQMFRRYLRKQCVTVSPHAAEAGRLPHTASAVAFIGPAGKPRPNWELELHGVHW